MERYVVYISNIHHLIVMIYWIQVG